MKNIVRIWIGNPYDGGHFNGTAFFIDKHTLVTAKHVIEDNKDEIYENIFLSNTPDGGVVSVSEVIRCDRDLAILKVKQAFDIDGVAFTNKLHVDDKVNIRGYFDKSSSQKSYSNQVSGQQSSEYTFELQNHLTHGLSGSPVFLGDKICGVTKAINSSKNLTYVVPIEELCMELKYTEDTEIEVEEQSTSLSIKDRIFNELYTIRIPFVIFMVLMVIFHKLVFTHGYQLEDAMVTYIVFAYLFSKVFLFVKNKIKRR